MALHPHDTYPHVAETRIFRDSVHQSGDPTVGGIVH